MAFVMLRIIFDTAHDMTSHNLWPFEIVLQAAVVLLLFAGLAFVRLLPVRRKLPPTLMAPVLTAS